jgi:signal transduction histidine kinase
MPTSSSDTTFTQQRDAVLAAIQRVICPYFSGVTPQSVELLVDSFFDALQGKPASQFLTLFSRLLWLGTMNLSRIELDEGIMAKWQEALSILRKDALPYKRVGVTADIDGLLHQGRILVAEATERTHSNLRGRAEASMLIQSEVIRDINAAPDTQRVVDVLAQSLPNLGIRTCALALYEGQPIPPPLSRLIMAYHNGKRVELEPDGRLFPTTQLIPTDMLPGKKRPFLVVHPLVVRDIHFGFIVMEMLVGHRIMYNTYEEFAEQIGSVLHRALLLQQIERSNEHLQQRAAELAEANAQLEQFAYAASHDLQEPLRMITSYLQLLERRYRDKLDTDAQEFIGYAVDGATRMKRMINDLLAYSRVVSRGQPLELTDCEHLLAQVLSNLEVTIKENDALITHALLPTVMADGTQLMEVFQNLIGNAIKFHADRPPQVHVAAQQTGDKWLFSVRDNGIGIAPEYTERIFVIFSRLHSQVQYPGTGIGLAICKKVVERHGGHIWVESQPGDGATFFFTIQA